jgi:diguanylate cyclase (GGDEF)-like protein/PAS domain S-box-containing protein
MGKLTIGPVGPRPSSGESFTCIDSDRPVDTGDRTFTAGLKPSPTALSPDQVGRLAYSAFRSNSDMICVTHWADRRIVEVNEAFLRMIGYSRGEVLGHTFDELGLWVEPARQQDLIAALRSQATVSGFELKLRTKSGETRVPKLSAEVIHLDGKSFVLGTYRDVPEESKRDQELVGLAAIVESSEDAIIGQTLGGIIESWNRGAERLYGYSAWEVVGRSESMLSPRHLPEEISHLSRLMSDESDHFETVRRRKDGSLIDVSLTVSPIRDQGGLLIGASSIARDITEQKRVDQEIAFLAYHDKLTGLANRALFEEHLDKALARARRANGAVAVLYLDLDNLKLVNDRLGHAAGDELITQTATRLTNVARETDFVARQGGDEFLILLADLPFGVADSVWGAVQAIEEVASRIQDQFQIPFRLADTEFLASASIGASIYPLDATDARTLLRNADAGMYRSKEAGKGELVLYAERSIGDREKLSLVPRLRWATEHDPWVLHYQPIVDLASGSIVGAEALIRWPQPDGTLMYPKEFISLAEDLGLVQRIGDWVVREVCRQAKAWQQAGLPIAVSFNLSPRQLWNPSLAEEIVTCLQSEGVDPHQVIVEITESAAMADPARTEAALEALSDQGLRLAIDDFGTGYSSLGRLRRLKVDLLKIDLSFLRDIPRDEEATRMMTAIVQLARTLGLTPVAEGVESEEQRQFLLERGCVLAQGYLLGPPVAASELAAGLSARPSKAAFDVRRLRSLA